MKRKGDVWHHVDGNTFDIVSGELERQKSTMKVRERNNFHILPTGFPMIWKWLLEESFFFKICVS